MNQVQNQMGHAFVHSVKRAMAEGREVPLIGNSRRASYDVGADIISHLVAHARATDQAAATGLDACVFTVPVNSTGLYRKQLRHAAESAGLRVESFAHEPFAAVFGYYFTQQADLRRLPPHKVLVFDWGGGTLDITLVQVEGNQVFELGNSNLDHCAGNEFTEALTSITRNKFLARTGVAADKLLLEADSKDRIWVNVENGKIQLSATSKIQINVPTYFTQNREVHDLSEEVTRSEYEARIGQDVDAARAKVFECLQRAGLEPASVDLVLLIGGTSRTPLVRQRIHEIFTAKVVAVDDADSIIAKGAAVISANKWRPYLVKPITVKLADKSYLPLFDHGQTLAAPLASKSFTFYCVDGRKGEAYLLFHEQQRPRDPAIQKTLNCNLTVPTDPAVRRVADLDRIHLNCFITEDLTIKVTAQSSSLGKTRELEIQDICYGLEIS
jgi:molecular chaperone DnaK (HSP70)